MQAGGQVSAWEAWAMLGRDELWVVASDGTTRQRTMLAITIIRKSPTTWRTGI